MLGSSIDGDAVAGTASVVSEDGAAGTVVVASRVGRRVITRYAHTSTTATANLLNVSSGTESANHTAGRLASSRVAISQGFDFEQSLIVDQLRVGRRARRQVWDARPSFREKRDVELDGYARAFRRSTSATAAQLSGETLP
jgi:hypothetical protein